jgi:hypothetical protein
MSSRICSYLVDILIGRIHEFPVQIPLARVDGTRVATAHGDNDVGVESHLVGQLSRRFIGDVNALFHHHFDDRRIQRSPGAEPAEWTTT